ncbi:MAG: hypothetical protein WDZ94_04810 [Patescibacteria group bacterium]
MNIPIERRDCMAQAVASVLERPELIESLRIIRDEQLQVRTEVLNLEDELKDLKALFVVAGESVRLQQIIIHQLAELDDLLEKGERVLIGFPKGQTSSPHLVHVAEQYGHQGIISWKGYRSNQQYLALDQLVISLMEQGHLQLFLIK